jgi:hypothetical protein
MNKTYRVLNTHDFKSENKIVHEYDIVKRLNDDGFEEITLYRSYEEHWAEENRGERLSTLIDTGDAVIFPKKKYIGEVDYATYAELYILMAFVNKTEHMPLFKGIIEEVTTKSFEI